MTDSEHTSTPSIGALVVTWNRKDDVLECVDSLLKTGYPHLSVYVVDNGSEDHTIEAINERYPDVITIRSEDNLGFAGGNNLGLSRILEDAIDSVFLVNDDVVVEKDTIDKLIDGGYDDPSVGVLSSKILLYDEPDIIWAAGGSLDRFTGITRQLSYGERDNGSHDKPVDIDYSIGCAMLVKSEAIRRIGFLDPRYFMYYEETDWCRRIRQAGYRILHVPESRARHKVTLEDTGRNSAAYYFSRNRLLYLDASGASQTRIAWIALSDILKSATVHAVKHRTRESHLMFKAVADYYSKNFGKLKEDK